MNDKNKGSEGKGHWFTTTSWTMIEGAKMGSKEALERLCNVYWYPLYAFARYNGHSPPDAEDLTQGFFYHLLEKNFFKAADRTKGKFRSFLLVAFKYFLKNERDYRMAEKRGGRAVVLSLDAEIAEERFTKEPSSNISPETLFEQHWANTVLEQVQAQLKKEYQDGGKLELYNRLKEFLSDETGSKEYNTVADELQMKPNAVAVAVHRLRHRYRDLIRSEIARTVASPGDVQSEMRHFFAAIGGSF